MKKLVSLVLALALCLGCLAGCGQTKTKEAESPKLIGVYAKHVQLDFGAGGHGSEGNV